MFDLDSIQAVTTRLVTQQECSWLPKDVPAGTSVITMHDMYGICTVVELDGVMVKTGTLVELVGWDYHHVELPNDCLAPVSM